MDPTRVIVLTPDELKAVIREAVAEALRAQADLRQTVQHKDWVTAKEAAGLYGLPATWFEERGRSGVIERTKPGRRVLFARRGIEAYLEKNKEKNFREPEKLS